jgi:tryptophan 2,3-dioxygenase
VPICAALNRYGWTVASWRYRPARHLVQPIGRTGQTFGPDGVEYISLHLATDTLRQVIGDNNLR